MNFCPHCMQPTTANICHHCGGQTNWTAAQGQLPVSTILQGSKKQPYIIGAARGQGGFGITYAAMDLNSSRRVAIKEYYPSHCSTRATHHQVIPMTGQDQTYRNGIKSFLEEAMMLSAVGALPSVVSVLDYFEANGTAYLVMEYIDGIPLHEVVNRRGKIPAAELLPKLEPLLQDLATLHRAKVIHRDISPDNLMLMPNGSLKLLDFGSARSVQEGKALTVLLKAGFSPVEQYQSRGQGPWTDVYALCATIYYCLTGVVPPSSIERLDGDTLASPGSLGARLTSAQEKALLRGLTVQPKARPANVDELRQQLLPSGGFHLPTTKQRASAETKKPLKQQLLDAIGTLKGKNQHPPAEQSAPATNVQNPPVRLSLQCLAGAFARQQFPLNRALHIGRDPARNSLVFPPNTQGISSVHCVIMPQGDQLWVTDLGSTYGTFLGGKQRLIAHQPVPLNIGDQIWLGSDREVFVITTTGGT